MPTPASAVVGSTPASASRLNSEIRTTSTLTTRSPSWMTERVLDRRPRRMASRPCVPERHRHEPPHEQRGDDDNHREDESRIVEARCHAQPEERHDSEVREQRQPNDEQPADAMPRREEHRPACDVGDPVASPPN